MLADLHVYGGLALLAGGIGWATSSPGVAIAIAGLGFIALGVLYALREPPEPAEPTDTEEQE